MKKEFYKFDDAKRKIRRKGRKVIIVGMHGVWFDMFRNPEKPLNIAVVVEMLKERMEEQRKEAAEKGFRYHISVDLNNFK